jgi:hypothetical protein
MKQEKNIQIWKLKWNRRRKNINNRMKIRRRMIWEIEIGWLKRISNKIKNL